MTATPTVEDGAESPSRGAEDLARSALRIARRFSRGASLWSVAPARVDHARHVAVEFVHPVVVGKRALPAEALVDADPVADVRRRADPGDIVIGIGPGDDPTLIEIARRAPAWGVEMFWIGWGARPPGESSATPLWLADGDEVSIVRSYHLLWELTHVCFEQPDVLGSGDDPPVSCAVCADDLSLAEVAEIEPGAAAVRMASGRGSVDTSLVGPVSVGDLLLVHAGVALRSLDEAR